MFKGNCLRLSPLGGLDRKGDKHILKDYHNNTAVLKWSMLTVCGYMEYLYSVNEVKKREWELEM